MRTDLVLSLWLLSCFAGLIVGRLASAKSRVLQSFVAASLSSVILIAAIITSSEAGVPLSRYFGFLAVGLAAAAFIGGLFILLRVVALAQDDDR